MQHAYTVYVRATDNGTVGPPADPNDDHEYHDRPLWSQWSTRTKKGLLPSRACSHCKDIRIGRDSDRPRRDGTRDGEVVLYPIDDNLTEHATTTWKWERSRSRTSGWVEITATTTANPMIDTFMRTPEESDVGFYLRATASYTDGQGENKTKSGVTAERVLKNLNNDPPVFRHADGNMYTARQHRCRT